MGADGRPLTVPWLGDIELPRCGIHVTGATSGSKKKENSRQASTCGKRIDGVLEKYTTVSEEGDGGWRTRGEVQRLRCC